MAKGNIGSLLQHFVALHVADRLLSKVPPEATVEYVDCYAMARWEPVARDNPQGFDAIARSFPLKQSRGDLVATAFERAWSDRYGSGRVPEHPLNRDYPNTALLLRSTFPERKWSMRLHDIGQNQLADLRAWETELNGSCRVGERWERSTLIENAPIADGRPALVMLDPYKVVPDDVNASVPPDGKLSPRYIRYLFGIHALNLRDRPKREHAAPSAVLIFSYDETEPDEADRLVRSSAPMGDGWTIERILTGEVRRKFPNRNTCRHQGWIISYHLEITDLQQAWDEWAAVT